jgi:hypothetical protein
MHTTLHSQPVISRDNRFPYRVRLERPNADTTLPELATGRTVIAFLALSEGGDAIDNTEVTLSEIPSSRRWNYAGELDGEVVNTVLDGLPSVLWVCYRIEDEELDVWAVVKIAKRRRAA